MSGAVKSKADQERENERLRSAMWGNNRAGAIRALRGGADPNALDRQKWGDAARWGEIGGNTGLVRDLRNGSLLKEAHKS